MNRVLLLLALMPVGMSAMGVKPPAVVSKVVAGYRRARRLEELSGGGCISTTVYYDVKTEKVSCRVVVREGGDIMTHDFGPGKSKDLPSPTAKELLVDIRNWHQAMSNRAVAEAKSRVF